MVTIQIAVTIMRDYEEVEDLPDTPGSTPTSSRPKLSAAAQITLGELSKSPRFLERGKIDSDADLTDTERPTENSQSLPHITPKPPRPPPPPPPGTARVSENGRPLSTPPSIATPASPAQRPTSGVPVGSPNMAALAVAAANRRNSQRGEALSEQLKSLPEHETTSERLSISSIPPALPTSQPPSRPGSRPGSRPDSPVQDRPEGPEAVTVGIHKLPPLPPLPAGRPRPPPVPGTAAAASTGASPIPNSVPPVPASTPPPIPPATTTPSEEAIADGLVSEEPNQEEVAQEDIDRHAEVLSTTGIAARAPSMGRPARPGGRRRGPPMLRAQTLRFDRDSA